MNKFLLTLGTTTLMLLGSSLAFADDIQQDKQTLKQETADIRQDRSALHQQQRDIRNDNRQRAAIHRQIHKDRKSGNGVAAQKSDAELQSVNQDIRQDRRTEQLEKREIRSDEKERIATRKDLHRDLRHTHH